MTLLEEALKIKPKNFISDEERKEKIDLAIAYVKGEITQTQAANVLGLKNKTTSYSYLATVLLKAGRDGLIKIEKNY